MAMSPDAASGDTGRAAHVVGVVCAAALGAAFGDLLFTAIRASFAGPSGLIAIAVTAPLMYLASLHFWDPLADGLRRVLGGSAAPGVASAPRHGLRALAVGSAILFVWAAGVLENYAQAHPGAVIATLLVAVVVVGGITLAWAIGARAPLPLSGILGAVTGWVVNAGATLAVLAHAGLPLTPDVVNAAIASGLSVGLSGLAGGLTIDSGLFRRPSLAAPLAALLMFAATALLGAWLAGTFSADFILPNIMLSFGWLLGLSGSRYADVVLRRR